MTASASSTRFLASASSGVSFRFFPGLPSAWASFSSALALSVTFFASASQMHTSFGQFAAPQLSAHQLSVALSVVLMQVEASSGTNPADGAPAENGSSRSAGSTVATATDFTPCLHTQPIAPVPVPLLHAVVPTPPYFSGMQFWSHHLSHCSWAASFDCRASFVALQVPGGIIFRSSTIGAGPPSTPTEIGSGAPSGSFGLLMSPSSPTTAIGTSSSRSQSSHSSKSSGTSSLILWPKRREALLDHSYSQHVCKTDSICAATPHTPALLLKRVHILS